MDLLSRTGFAGLAFSRTLMDQTHRVAALSSGLRIGNAADDPSGMAIASAIQSRVAGLQKSQENVQDASHLLNVAGGALASVRSILQRMHALAVEATSDFRSPTELEAIQHELDALKSEINAIAGKTSFNGRRLLDGSLNNATAQAAHVREIAAAPVNGAVPVSMVTNADGLGTPGPLVSGVTVSNGVEASTVEFAVVGYDPVNAVDPVTGPLGGPGLYVQVTAFSNDPSFGAGQQITSITAVPENGGPITAVLTTPSGSSTFLQFTLANLTGADVGVAQAFTTYHDQAAATGSPLMVNSGGTEGSLVQVSLPALSTQTLAISDVSVLTPSTVDINNNPTGPSNSNQTAAKDAQVRMADAIEALSALSATVGAQTVSLQEDAANAAIYQVNLEAAGSRISSADIGLESTLYTRNGVMLRVAQEAIAAAQQTAKSFGSAMADNITSVHHA